MEEREYGKRGYLREPFRLFHLRDVGVEELEYHYHEFDKLVIFLSGRASYLVEGRSYELEPWDLVLVRHHQIHKPVIDPERPYERVVIYISGDFLAESSGPEEKLDACFRLAEERRFALLRPRPEERERLSSLLEELERALKEEGFGRELLGRAVLLQLLVELNRMTPAHSGDRDRAASRYDPKIADTLVYIQGNLDADLRVDALARRAYMSKYHFMRRFRTCTGCTVHSYVTQKRLLAAADLLREGSGALAACARCGFQDYSAFQRAFRKQFGVNPRELMASRTQSFDVQQENG